MVPDYIDCVESLPDAEDGLAPFREEAGELGTRMLGFSLVVSRGVEESPEDARLKEGADLVREMCESLIAASIADTLEHLHQLPLTGAARVRAQAKALGVDVVDEFDPAQQ